MQKLDKQHSGKNIILQTRGLTKTFRDFWRRPTVVAVKDLDLTIYAGEVFGLLGPNGSGKSTTIKMLLGLLHPTSGIIRILNTAPTGTRAKAEIGYLPEVSHLHPFLTPRELLRYYAALFGLNAHQSQARIEELLELVDLKRAADRTIGGFSKGMARRVGIAQALINAPKLLILDEPTSGLDPIGTREVKDLVSALAQRGVTILLTSHLLADVEDVCHRVAILSQGQLQAAGKIADLLCQPEDVRFQVSGLNADDSQALKRQLEHKTGRTVLLDHPAMSLEAFFLATVASKDQLRTFKLPSFLGSAPLATPSSTQELNDESAE